MIRREEEFKNAHKSLYMFAVLVGFFLQSTVHELMRYITAAKHDATALDGEELN